MKRRVRHVAISVVLWGIAVFLVQERLDFFEKPDVPVITGSCRYERREDRGVPSIECTNRNGGTCFGQDTPPGVMYTLGMKLEIEKATEAELALLPGIGSIRARSIVEYRNEHGSLDYLENLMKIRGIGSKTLDRISDYATITPGKVCEH